MRYGESNRVGSPGDMYVFFFLVYYTRLVVLVFAFVVVECPSGTGRIVMYAGERPDPPQLAW